MGVTNLDPPKKPSGNEGGSQRNREQRERQSTSTRREFLKVGATAALGFASRSILLPTSAQAFPSDLSRVVIVTDQNVLQGSSIDASVVRIMVDAGIKALTGTDSTGQAWRMIFPDLTTDMAVGLKINTINYRLSTHPPVSMAIAESLATIDLGGPAYPLNQIVIWDRTDNELEAAGYDINTGTTGVRCFATDHPGIGYQPRAMTVNGVEQLVSRCYGTYSDRLINIGCLKNHTLSGLTGALKNHYGTINDPEHLHGDSYDYCDPYIPALNTSLLAAFGIRQRLVVNDALFGIRFGGPMGPPQLTYRGLLFATDPVALDATLRDILTTYQSNTMGITHHIDTASAPPYELGISDLAQIERIDIIDPSIPVSAEPAGMGSRNFQLQSPRPNPTAGSLIIPLVLTRTNHVSLTIHDMSGRLVATVFRGRLDAGRHAMQWNGRDRWSGSLRAGHYIATLDVENRRQSKTFTILK